jgi:VanZ family protein
LTAAFIGIILVSAAGGFSTPDYKIPTYGQSDKALHFVAFFALTLSFYWIIETARRKVLQLTFTVCTLGLGFASEIIQGLLPVSGVACDTRTGLALTCVDQSRV